MPDSPASVPAMNSSAGGWRHGPSNGIDEHDDGLARIGQFSVDHLDREDHVVTTHHRSFAQGYDNFGNLAFGIHDLNGCIGRIVCKGVFSLGDQFHEYVPGQFKSSSL